VVVIHDTRARECWKALGVNHSRKEDRIRGIAFLTCRVRTGSVLVRAFSREGGSNGETAPFRWIRLIQCAADRIARQRWIYIGMPRLITFRELPQARNFRASVGDPDSCIGCYRAVALAAYLMTSIREFNRSSLSFAESGIMNCCASKRINTWKERLILFRNRVSRRTNP